MITNKNSRENSSNNTNNGMTEKEKCFDNIMNGKDKKIFIDTCSMLDGAFPLFIEHAMPLLEEQGNRIIVPVTVNRELIRLFENPKKPELQKPALRALQILDKYKSEYFRILGEENDSRPDNLFQNLYIEFREKYHMLFITQDKGLAADLLNSSNSYSVHGKGVLVKRITSQGYLNNLSLIRENGFWMPVKFARSNSNRTAGAHPAAKPANSGSSDGTRPGSSPRPDHENHSASGNGRNDGKKEELARTCSYSNRNSSGSNKYARNISNGNVFGQKSQGKFNVCVKPTGMRNEVLQVTELPGAGDTVYARNPRKKAYAEVNLGERLASGGEGAVYRTNTQFVAKIYLKEQITTLRREKVLRMAGKDLAYSGICFPVIPLYNRHEEFIGYLMKEARGRELGRSVFCPYIKNVHPDWKREDLVQLCMTILKKINYLHSMNIIIGDINPGNILVNSPKEVYFVDTDSFQIEDLPCPVGQCNYTAPEIQGKEYSSFLRTMGNENFAIATLLFQILLPGKLPYAHTGGGRQNENIMNMNFPYPLGERKTGQVPDGQWKYMWSHLTYEVKEAFYNTFQKDGKYSKEETRLSADAWRTLMEHYYGLLHTGTLVKQDPMSEDIFPTRLKGGRDAEWITCRHCGKKFPYYSKSNSEGKEKASKRQHPFRPVYCQECQRTVQSWIVCKDCGIEFPLYVPEYENFQEKGLVLPKRCPKCRANRNKEKEKAMEKKKYGGLNFNMDIPGKSESNMSSPKEIIGIPDPAAAGSIPENGTWSRIHRWFKGM